MKHLTRIAALMMAAVIFALPLGAQSRGGHSSGHGSASSSYNNNHSRSGSSSSVGSSSSGSRSYSGGGSSSDRRNGTPNVSSGSSSGKPNVGSGSNSKPSGGNGHVGKSGNGNKPSGGSGHVGPGSGNKPSSGNGHVSHSGSGNKPSGGSGHVSHGDRPHGDRPHGDRPRGDRPAPGTRHHHYGDGSGHHGSGHVHVNPNPGHRPPRPNHHVHRELRGTPAHFSYRGHHGYGHYVAAPPAYYIHRIYNGIDYYYWDNVWYRYRAGRYWVCRPPIGYVFSPLADAVFTAVLLNELAEREYAASVAKGSSTLNLVRNYAAAGTEYFYNDGVFYVRTSDGDYKVIVPPAGAMVDYLPEDFEEFEFNGETYYKVDDTVYGMTISEDGRACFEVLGQLVD